MLSWVDEGQDTGVAIQAYYWNSASKGAAVLILPLEQDRGWGKDVFVDEAEIIVTHEVTLLMLDNELDLCTITYDRSAWQDFCQGQTSAHDVTEFVL